MKKTYAAILACLLSISFATPVWATGNGHNPSHYDKLKERVHQMIVDHQLQALKRLYGKTDPEARQLFMNYLGTAVPSAQEQMEAMRQDYDRQIADLNTTISSYQQRLDSLATEINATCETRLTLAQETFQAAAQQQIVDLAAAHQSELYQLTDQLNSSCDARLMQAYDDWQATAGENCQQSGPLAKTSALNTVDIYPFAIDVDSSGNIFVLDNTRGGTVRKYDAGGTETAQWQSVGFAQPYDIAVDSQGNVFVLDRQASEHLQKFGSDGTPLPFSTDPGHFTAPVGLFIDRDDLIYVTDRGGAYGGRILTFDANGELVGSFGEVSALAWEQYNDLVVDEEIIYLVTGNYVAKFKKDGDFLGSWRGDFQTAHGIVVAANGDIVVADTSNEIIDVYDSDGLFKYSFANDLFLPHRICTDAAGRLYVADYGNMQIKIYQ